MGKVIPVGNPLIVCVMTGYTGTQMSTCSFNKGKLSVLSYAYCPVGGRSFDEAICRFFCDEFRDRYKLDVLANKKALLKLLLEADKERRAHALQRGQLRSDT